MTQEQVTGIIRAVAAAAGGFVVAKGWVSGETWAWLVGGAATVGPAVWSWFANRPASIAASAQNIKGVEVSVTSAAPAGVASAVADAKATG
jgi:hypothetical protein